MEPPSEEPSPEVKLLLPRVVQSISDGLVLTDPEGRVTWVNRGFQELCGYGAEELQGKKPGSVLQGPGTDPTTVMAMRRSVARAEPSTHQILNYHKDGHPYLVSIHIAPVFSRSGDLLRFVALERSLPFLEPVTGAAESMKDLRMLLKTALPPEILVPMCAWCNRVRDRKGTWHRIEDFLFIFHREICSHSICPICEREKRVEGPA